MKLKPVAAKVEGDSEEGGEELVSRFTPKEAKKTRRLVLENLDAGGVMELVNRAYGEGTLLLASNPVLSTGTTRLPTGILALDISLGGGFGCNRVIELFGPPQSFKSTVSLRTLALWQRVDSNAWGLYVDAERTFDAQHAARLGVDCDRLFVFNPDSGEQAVDGVRDLLTWDVPLLVIVDSVAAMVPAAELAASAEQQGMGQHARLMNKFMRVLVARMKRSRYTTGEQPITVILLNQLRMKVGVMFGNPETTPGGMGKDFACSQTVRLSRQKSKAKLVAVRLPDGSSHQVQVAQVVSFAVHKNKCGGPQSETGEFVYYERAFKGFKAGSVDNASARVHYGLLCNLIRWTKDLGYSYKGLNAKKLGLFTKRLQEDTRLSRALELEILEITAQHGLTGDETNQTTNKWEDVDASNEEAEIIEE